MINGKSLLDYTHPINTLYLSKDSTSPAQLFGGVWENLIENGFLTMDIPQIKASGLFELLGGYGENIGFITPSTIIAKNGGTGVAYFVNNNSVTGTAINSKLSYYKGLALELPNGVKGVYLWVRVE